MRMEQENKRKLVVCIENDGYMASLEPRKLYESIPDELAKQHNQIRIIDESGGGYLYPARYFACKPNDKTIQAMQEARNGGLKPFDSINRLTDLNTDD